MEELSIEQMKDEELQELLKGESALELKEFTRLSHTTLLQLLKKRHTALPLRNSEETDLRYMEWQTPAESSNIKSDKNSFYRE